MNRSSTPTNLALASLWSAFWISCSRASGVFMSPYSRSISASVRSSTASRMGLAAANASRSVPPVG